MMTLNKKDGKSKKKKGSRVFFLSLCAVALYWSPTDVSVCVGRGRGSGWGEIIEIQGSRESFKGVAQSNRMGDICATKKKKSTHRETERAVFATPAGKR
jgi:hypothetical protein